MKSLLYINKYLYKYRYRLLGGVVFVALSAWLKAYSALFIKKSVDWTVAILSKHAGGIRTEEINHLLMLGVVFFGMTLISGFFLFLQRQTIIVTSRLIEYDLKNEIFDHYQKLDLAFYKRNNTGDLMNRISEDVSRARNYFGPALMYTINTICTLAFTLIFMLKISVVYTIYVLSPMPILYLSVYYVSNLINNRSTLVQQQLSVLFSRAQETFSGIRIIKSYRMEKIMENEFSKECLTYKKRNMYLATVDSLFQPFLIFLIGLSTVLIVYIGGRQILQHKVTEGDVLMYMIYVYNLTMPVASIGWITSMVQRAAASQTRINEFLQTEPEIKSPVVSGQWRVNEDNLRGDIEFSDVTFVYPDSGIKALNNVSFTIKNGESLGIVGRTGSGKSTIAQLLCRLYDVDSGVILMDGKNIKNIPLATLRKQLGYVPQEVFLFSDTIAGNIAFSGAMASGSGVEEAAKDAAIYDNIMEFKDGFKTIVGERGVTLSGGQKQRVSIARALLNAPNILLFDDCLSAVDTNTEQEILLNIQKYMEGRTTIIISHRISSVKMCNKMLVLDHGKVAEYGSHEQLIAINGLYKDMYEMQLTEELRM